MLNRLLRTLRLSKPHLHEDWKILAQLPRPDGHHIVLDVGAHHGWFLRWWKAWCPSAEIHAFEPAEAAARYLRRTFSGDGIVINQLGVSDRPGSADLHVMADMSSSSSFLPPIADAWERQQIRTGEITTAQVPLTTIDRYCEEKQLKDVFLLKLDVQGYELKALAGAERTLAAVSYVLVESSVKPMYQGAPVFTEVYAYLAARGFGLMDMSGWKGKDGEMVEVDMLFRNRNRP
ncbi:MAG: FkbM family methyltransferase [Candidatus Binatia bacterium]|jgi:FkbM family methyltransferase